LPKPSRQIPGLMRRALQGPRSTVLLPGNLRQRNRSPRGRRAPLIAGASGCSLINRVGRAHRHRRSSAHGPVRVIEDARRDAAVRVDEAFQHRTVKGGRRSDADSQVHTCAQVGHHYSSRFGRHSASQSMSSTTPGLSLVRGRRATFGRAGPRPDDRGAGYGGMTPSRVWHSSRISSGCWMTFDSPSG
jgi:hypothetical protein